MSEPRNPKHEQLAKDLMQDIQTLIIDDKEGYDELCKYVDEIQPKILEYAPLVEEQQNIGEESYHKRRLHADLELIRLDFNQLKINDKLETIVSKMKTLKKKQYPEVYALLEDSAAYKKAYEVYNILDNYRNILKVCELQVSLIRRLLNFLSFVIYLFVCINTCIILTPPLFLLEPLLVKKFNMKPYRLPTDNLQRWFCRSCCYWGGVDVLWEHMDRIDQDQSYCIQYSHQSSYDAWILCTGPLSIKLMGKPSLFHIPFLGWLAQLWRHIPIPRTDLDKAKKAIDYAVDVLKETRRSTAIAPEGTRSTIGRLIDFKKGPFHLALQAQMPILPLLIFNAHELWPGSNILNTSGRVVVRVLNPIDMKKDETYKQLRYRVHKEFLYEYQKPISKNLKSNGNDLLSFFSLPLCVAVTTGVYWGLWKGISYFF